MTFCKKIFVAILLLIATIPAHSENWPCCRGPRLDGTSLETGIPRVWSSSSNVAWKAELPGIGHASPIIWNNRVFTVAAVAQDEARVLLCLDRQTGKILWR